MVKTVATAVRQLSTIQKLCLTLVIIIISQFFVNFLIFKDVKGIFLNIERMLSTGFRSKIAHMTITSLSRSDQNSSVSLQQDRIYTEPAIISTALPLCPMVPPGLVGPINASLDSPTFEELHKLYSNLEPGGRWKPKDCISRHRVAIVVPYRNREDQLKTLLYNMHSFLQKQQLDYGIYIAEQVANETFNRGMLMNVGYNEARQIYDYQCYIFHDVDLIPEDDRNIYSCPSPDKARHMSIAVDKFKYKLPYNGIFGGICALTAEQVVKTNGFSNVYFGWGGEDDDFRKRVVSNKFTVVRYPMDIGKYKMIKHKRDQKVNEERMTQLRTSNRRQSRDGVNSLLYDRKSLDFFKVYTRALVHLKEKEIRRLAGA